jgi:hypothetical protein
MVEEVHSVDWQRYEMVDVLDSGAMLLRERAKPSMGTVASSGMSRYGNMYREDYNAELRGHIGRQKYEKMRKSDAQVRATLRLVKTPVLSARWYVDPASQTSKDKRIAEFVENCLFKWQEISWPQLLSEILVMMDFGFSAFVKEWTEKRVSRGQTRVVWKQLSPRHPLNVFNFFYTDSGEPDYYTMGDPNAHYGLVEIPVSRSLVFSFDKEGGDFEGVSILRTAYQNWFYKQNLYKVDAIQKERHGIGIPLIYLPPGFTDDDKILADEIGRNLRTNEKAHVVLPFNWKIEMLKLEGNMTDALQSAEHHDLMIARNVLGQFINSQAAGGNASSADQVVMFQKATRYIADVIRDVFNKWAIPELVDFNFSGIDSYPELRVRRIGDTQDWRTMSFAIRNFIGAGAVTPDEALEDWIRDEMDLPMREDDSSRFVVPWSDTPMDPMAQPVGAGDVSPGPGGEATAATRQNQGAGAVAQGLPKSNNPQTRQTGPTAKPVTRTGGAGKDVRGK